MLYPPKNDPTATTAIKRTDRQAKDRVFHLAYVNTKPQRQPRSKPQDKDSYRLVVRQNDTGACLYRRVTASYAEAVAAGDSFRQAHPDIAVHCTVTALTFAASTLFDDD